MKKRFILVILIIAVGVLVAGYLDLNSAERDAKSRIDIAAADISATATTPPTIEMDPNMPGMTHIESAPAARPVSIVLGTFGFGVTTVFIWAGLARRRDRREAAARKLSRVSTGLSK